jgi:dihydroneopterin aldolase
MWVEANLNMAKKNDSLKDTVDYVFLLSCIKKEMNVRSKLLEVVAERIINSVFSGSSIVKTVCVKISKINPPIGGNVNSVSLELKRSVG